MSRWMNVRLASCNLAVLSFLVGQAGPALAQVPEVRKAAPAMSVDRTAVEKIIAGWPERPRLGVAMTMAEHGAPQEATTEQMVWHHAGPFKRITVYRMEYPHDFPLPHMDFLEHTIEYNVPVDKTADLIAFDGSSTINRTAGELSARCDLAGHNILTLNLDHDIVTGKKTVEQARKAFGENVVADVLGQHPAYVEALQFPPAGPSARFPDQPVIPGSPKRAMPAAIQPAPGRDLRMTDAEVLAAIIAIDQNEIVAASQAEKRSVSPQVLDYAKRLHEAHGLSQVNTMKLGQQIGVTPAGTPAVDQLLVKGAGELATLLRLDDARFGAAYIAAMVKGHTETLGMIDNQLLQSASNAALKQHLTETRQHVADHLEKGKALQGVAGR